MSEPTDDEMPLRIIRKSGGKSDRMAKLLRMMTSTNDAEAVAATRKFFAECERNGVSMMMLAERLVEQTMAEKVNDMAMAADAASKERASARMSFTPERARTTIAYIEAYTTGLMPWNEELLARVRAATSDIVGDDADALGRLYETTRQQARWRKTERGDRAKREAERKWDDYYQKRFERMKEQSNESREGGS